MDSHNECMLLVNYLSAGVFCFFSETQVKPYDPCTPLQPPDGELLLSCSVLRSLRLLPLSTLQHHLPLLENEPVVLKEDVDAAQTHRHTCTDTAQHVDVWSEKTVWGCFLSLTAQVKFQDYYFSINK